MQGAFFFTHLIRAPEGVVARSIIPSPIRRSSRSWRLEQDFRHRSLPTLILLQNLTIPGVISPGRRRAPFIFAAIFGARHRRFGGGRLHFRFQSLAHRPGHAPCPCRAASNSCPLFALCYLLALERKSYRWLGGAIIFYALSALSCWYYLFYCLYFLAFHLLYLRVHEHRWPRGWRSGGAGPVPGRRRACCLSPLILPMALQRPAEQRLSARRQYLCRRPSRLYSPFRPRIFWAHLSTGLYASFTGNAWEITVYLGFVNLALLAWGFWRCPERLRAAFYGTPWAA